MAVEPLVPFDRSGQRAAVYTVGFAFVTFPFLPHTPGCAFARCCCTVARACRLLIAFNCSATLPFGCS